MKNKNKNFILIRYFSIFLIFFSTLFSEESKSNSTYKKKDLNSNNLLIAEEFINHAMTYHWLARHKNNNARDILKSKNYFQNAVNIFKDFDIKNIDKEIQFTINQAINGLEDSENRYNNTFDNINNEYQLFDIITKRNKTYEFFDEDLDVVSINNAAEAIISVIPPQRKDFQYNTIILSDPKKTHLEDEIRVFLNSQTQFFPRSIEDILSIISIEEYNQLYDNILNRKILKKIAQGWDKDKLFLVKIVENDIIDDIIYQGIYIYEWDVNNSKILRSAYEDGFVQDRLNTNNFATNNFIIFILILIFTSYFSKYFFYFKDSKDRRPVYLLTGVYSFIINLVLLYFIVESLIFLAPDSGALAILPYSRFWIALFIFSCAILPFIISYFIFVITPYLNERLNDSETIHSLILGVVLSQIYLFNYYHIIESNNLEYNLYGFIFLFLYNIFLIWFSNNISNFFLTNNKSSIFSLFGLLIFQSIIIYSIMINDMMLIPALTVIIFSILLVYNKKILIIFKNSEKNIKSSKNISNEDYIKLNLLSAINEPPVFIDPSDKGNYISNQVSFFTNQFDNKSEPHVMLIEGPQGIGKTRLANEIANRIISDYNNKFNLQGRVLYGDCDELNKSGTGVPYEPFSQALHEILGAGRFEPPNKKANKIKEGINATGLNEILDIGGLGVLNLLLGSGNDEIKSATTNEMSSIVYQTLEGLSKNSPVVLIIDDLHWMDEITFNLFKLLLNKISKNLCKNIFLIFTSRYNDKIEKMFPAISLIKDLEKNNKLKLINIKHSDFNYKERFDELLIRSLKFEKNSTAKYLKFINDYEIDNILTVLQSIKTLVDNKYLDYKNEKVILNKNYSAKKLKPPKDIVDVINTQLKELTVSQLNIIKFASFIGHEFRASILTEALKLDRLQVLYDLEVLEEKNIIVDIRSQDDVYEFKSNAIINVVRYMTKISEGEETEIPQIVREYHFRVAKSIKNKIKLENKTIEEINNQLLFNLAKRSWAAGDRMLEDAINYNTIALKKSFKQFRYEESIMFGKNILEMREKFRDKTSIDKVLEIKLIICQSLIIIGGNPEEIDKIIEESKLLLIQSTDFNEKSFWDLMILNVEADALIHDHSGFFETQRNDILSQLKSKINAKNINSNFSIHYANLSMIRIDKTINDNKKYELLKDLLETIKIQTNKNEDLTKNPISGFINDSIVDYMILESEVLEEIIHLAYILNDSSLIFSYIEECKIIKSNNNINDQEGLSVIHLNEGNSYLKQKKYIKSLECFNQSLSISKRIGNEKIEVSSNIGLSKIHFEKNEYNLSLDFLIESLKLDILNDFDLLYNIHNGIIKVAIATKNIDLYNEYEKDIKNIFESDLNKGYLYDELLSNFNKCKELYKDDN